MALTEAEAREMRKLKAQNAELTTLVDWYRAREHQAYVDDTNPEWVEQVRVRRAARIKAPARAA